MKTYNDLYNDLKDEPKNDVETLDESFLSSITTAVSLSKTVQIAKRVSSKKIRKKKYPKTRRTQQMSKVIGIDLGTTCLLYTSPSPRDATLSRMTSSA